MYLTTADTGGFTGCQLEMNHTRTNSIFQNVFKMSSDVRGDNSYFLFTVNVNELERSTSGWVYLNQIVSQ